MPLLDEIPEWARILEASDPTSLQPNREEATETKKDTGFNFREFVPRQDLNYLQNLNGRWIKAFRNLNSSYIQGWDHLGVVDEGGGVLSMQFKRGAAMSDNKEMLFDANVDPGWPGPLLKKLISSNFVVGDGNGGLANPLTLGASAWYHSFVVRVLDGPTVSIDVGFDTSIVAANLVANNGITHWRRISSFWLDSGAAPFFGMDFIQNGDFFFSKTKFGGGGINITINSGEQTKVFNEPRIPKDFRSKVMWKSTIVSPLSTASVNNAALFGDEQVGFPAGVPVVANDFVDGERENPYIWTFHDGVAQTLTVENDANPTATWQTLLSLAMYVDERGRNDF